MPVEASSRTRISKTGEFYFVRLIEPPIGHGCLYKWLALQSFSTAAWKCAARGTWIGWDFRHQYDRLHLIANNSRFPILPEHHVPNLPSRVLALSERRLAGDGRERFGYPLLLLETFVNPQRFRGTLYQSATWHHVGDARGFRRTRTGYSTALSRAPPSASSPTRCTRPSPPVSPRT